VKWSNVHFVCLCHVYRWIAMCMRHQVYPRFGVRRRPYDSSRR